jgi:ferric-dicitrate binding protein FerR (iron transport regulator)
MKEIAFKYFEGLATEKELEQLLEWLRKKENRIVFDKFRLVWQSSLEREYFPDGGREIWNRIQAQLWQKSFKKWQSTKKIDTFFKYAAIFFFVLAIGSLTWYFTHRPVEVPETFTTVAADKGHVSKVQLPDGSKVWINSGSEISYNNLFASSNRNIKIKGEAYFDVAKNENIPMIINCGEVNVKVTGTSFNINNYSWEKDIEVVLEAGSVEMTNITDNSTLYRLNPGNRLLFSKKENKITVSEANTAKYTSWKDGIMNLYDLTMEEVLMRLNTRYNQKFEIDSAVKDFKYTFTIKNEPLHEILHLMEKITPVIIKQKGEIISIKVDKNKMKRVEG